MIHKYAGVETVLEDHDCPHCGKAMEAWLAPPDSGWGVILVCQNNECPHYKNSDQDIVNKRDDCTLGCRYALDPDNKYKPFNLVAMCF